MQSSPASRPQFFKVILQPSIRDGKLMIPVEFVRKFGEELSGVVVLKVPGGREWSIELEKIDGEVWLRNGWPGFLKHYNISAGHFVVFRYDGNSHFFVFIVNEYGCEIKYPDNVDTPGESNLRNKGPIIESEDRGRGIQISLGKRPASTWEIGSTSKLSRLSRKKRMKNKDQKEMEELPYGCELDGSKEGEDRKKRTKKKDQREMKELPYGCEVDGSKEGEDTFRVEQDEHLGKSLAERTRRPVTTKESGVQISLGKRPASTWEIGSTSKLSRLSRKKRMKNKDQKEMEELPYGCELDGSKEGEDRKKRMKKKDQREMKELPYGCEVDGSKEGEDTFRVEQDEHLGKSLAERTRRPVTTKESGVQISLEKTPASTCEIGSTSKLSRFSKKKRMKNKDQREMEELPYGCELDGSKEGEDRKKRMKKKDQREMEELPYGCELDGSKEGEDTFCVEQDEHLGTPLSERTRRPVTAKEREKAKHLAQKLNTERPSSFMVVMKPSYLRKGLNVPLPFAREHFTEGKHNVKLKLLDGRTWSVKFYVCEIKALLSGGWKAFVQQNMLEDGDCCVFELLKVEKIELKVSIFRVTEKVVQLGSFVIARKKPIQMIESKATQEARDFKSEKPFFKVYMRPTYAQRSYMIMRTSFVKKHLKKPLERVILQDADGRKWPIRCIIKRGQCKLGCGWAKFAKKNDIEEGDVCVFELIERKGAVLKVSIFKSH